MEFVGPCGRGGNPRTPTELPSGLPPGSAQPNHQGLCVQCDLKDSLGQVVTCWSSPGTEMRETQLRVAAPQTLKRNPSVHVISPAFPKEEEAGQRLPYLALPLVSD